MRSQVKTIHKWCALILGGWLFLQILSGFALLYKPQLKAGLYPVENDIVSSISIDETMENLSQSHPNYRLTRFTFPTQTVRAYVIRLEHIEEGTSFDAVVVNSQRVVPLSGLSRIPNGLFNFHDHLLNNNWGRKAVSILAITMCFWCISGVYLWWPLAKRRPLNIRWSARRGLLLFDIHRVFGVLLSVSMFVMAVTALLMIYRTQIIKTFRIDSAALASAEDMPCASRPSLDGLVLCLLNGEKNEGIKAIRFSRDGDAARILMYEADVLRPKAITQVYYSMSQQSVTTIVRAKDESFGLAFMNWAYPVHTGQYLGRIGNWLMSLLALGMLSILITGVWMWLNKKTRSKKKMIKGKRKKIS